MSKSTGNVVNPFFAIDRFGVDTMRYYLAREGGIKDDASYDNIHIIRRYDKDLKGQLGNLASRLTRSKRWNIRAAVRSAEDQQGMRTDALHSAQCDLLLKQYDIIANHMSQVNVPAALNATINIVYQVSLR